MRRYLLEQRKQAQPKMGELRSGGTNLLGSGLTNTGPRFGSGISGGGLNTGARLGTGSSLSGNGLRSTGLVPNTGMGYGVLRQHGPLLSGRTAPVTGPQTRGKRGTVHG